MIKRNLLKHRFAQNSDYSVSYIINGQRVSLTIPNMVALEANNHININRELSLDTTNDVVEIEDTFEEDLRSIRANMVETMGFSDIRFPIMENISESNYSPNGLFEYVNNDGTITRINLQYQIPNKFSNSIFTSITELNVMDAYYRNRMVKGRMIKHNLTKKKGIPNYIKYDRRVTYLNHSDNLIHSLFGLSHG